MDKVGITESNLYNLSGEYEMFADYEYRKEVDKKASLEKLTNNDINFYRKVTNRPFLKDSTAQYSIKLESSKTIAIFIFSRNNIPFDTISIKTVIKRNGFYYLDNTKTTCHGIPYLFGGCQQTKMRLGLSNKGELIVNTATDNSGAFLFFFWAGQQYNTCYFFKKKV